MAKPRKAGKASAESAGGARILVVEARFYDDIADALLAGATRSLERAGATFERVTVPGALEIPTAIAIALDNAEREGRSFDGVVALGCVIRGGTGHYEIVATQSARALMDLSVALRLPLGNGVLTVDTEAQAWERARPDQGDKGGAAVESALALVRLKRRVAGGSA